MRKKDPRSDDESRWRAISARDPAAEGTFVYAVTTTGVFCRPGCASRLPGRENVRFFDTVEAAERAGYRPCKRCTPGIASPRERLAAAMVRACRRIEQSEKWPTLDELAAEARLSVWHFQRQFRQIVGVTPKQYADSLRARRFRDRLRTGSPVTEAVYEAGFGSTSRAHDGARDRLGMTPSRYRKGGAGMRIRYAIARCSLGWIVVAGSERGICAIEFGDDPRCVPALLEARFPRAHREEAGPDFAAVVETVVAAVETPAISIELPLDIRGTVFQERVWNALRRIRPGTTLSYAEIARSIGKPEAARAVAQACAANRLAVIVPCHRAVRADGTEGGYRWGAARKRALLLRERDAADFPEATRTGPAEGTASDKA